MSVGDNILRIRKKQNISIAKFAELIGTSRQAVYDIESGKHKPNSSKLVKIAQVLGVTVSDLYQESEQLGALVAEPSAKYLDKDSLIQDLMAREASLLELNALLKSTLAEKDKIIVLLEEKVKWLEAKISTL